MKLPHQITLSVSPRSVISVNLLSNYRTMRAISVSLSISPPCIYLIICTTKIHCKKYNFPMNPPRLDGSSVRHNSLKKTGSYTVRLLSENLLKM